jgi:hypothetical protein
MTKQQWSLLIAAASPIWLAVLFYYGGRVVRWLDGKPWKETK